MPDKQTVAVTGVPVPVQVTDGHLAVIAGRFDPSAAAGLHVHPRYRTSCVGLYIADENCDTARKPGQRWFSGLHPALPARTGGGEPVVTAPDAGPDMTGTHRVIERTVTESAADVGDDVVLERGLSGTASEITAKCPPRPAQMEGETMPAKALDAFTAARAAVLGGLGTGGSERDNDLPGLVEGMFTARRSGTADTLDDIIRRRGDDPSKVRQWWPGMGVTGSPAGKFIAAITYTDSRPRTWTEGPWTAVLADLLRLDPASVQDVNLCRIVAEWNPPEKETRTMTYRADLVQCPHDEWLVRIVAEGGETVLGWLRAGQAGPGQYTPESARVHAPSWPPADGT